MIQEKLNNEIETISKDFTNGSTQIALNAAKVLIKYSKGFESKEIIELKDNLKKSKPSMTALSNILEMAYKLICDNPGFSNDELTQKLCSEINTMTERTVKNAITYLTELKIDTIYTCSYSSTVEKAIKDYSNIRKDLNIFLINSIWNNRNYASRFSDKLISQNINYKTIDLNQIYDNESVCGLISADTVVLEKNVNNGAPSKDFSRKLNELKIPLFVAAEAFKYSDTYHLEDGFEEVSNSFIEKVFS